VYFDFKAQEHDSGVLAKNLAWWSEFRQGTNAIDLHAYIVGEVTRDTAAELVPWFKPLNAVFDFPLANKLIESARSERAGDLASVLEQTDAALYASTGKHGIDAPFLSNHDQNRVMSQLDGNPQHMRMAAALLLTLPGQPFVYYGEELGMRGQKPDPDLREPMRWNRAADAPGETTWKTSTSHDGPTVSVEAEQADPDSLLHYYTMLIRWRSQLSALRDGAIHAHTVSNPHIAAWQLDDTDSRVLVVHNLSGQTQNMMLGDDRFHAVLLHSKPGVTLQHDRLQIPPYSTAILQ
jgi:glycosidase